MPETRYLELNSFSNSVFCVPFPAFINPHDGSATIQMAVSRESEDSSPYTILIKKNGSVNDSTTLTNPSEEELLSFTIPASELAGCENNLEACVTAYVSTPCCTEYVPASLIAHLDFHSLCPCDEPITVPLNYNSISQRWEGVGDVYSCPEAMGNSNSKTWYIFLACSEECSSGWELQMSPCEGEIECSTAGGCSPMSFEFSAAALFDCCDRTSIYGNVHVSITG